MFYVTAWCALNLSLFRMNNLDEDIKSFSTVADKKVGELAPFILNIFFKIICHHCLKKHSRTDSHQVAY